MKRLKKIAKYLFRTALGVGLLLLFLILIISMPITQKALTAKVEDFLQKKIQTKVEIGAIELQLPSSIALKELYVEDLNRDTLLQCSELALDINLFSLLQQKVEANGLSIRGLTANVTRIDTVFNFDFILNAFADTDTLVIEASQSPWTFDIEKADVVLDDVYLSVDDHLAGLILDAKVGTLDTDIEGINLTESHYEITHFSCYNTSIIYKEKNSTLSDTTTTIVETDTPTADLSFLAHDLDLMNVSLDYQTDSLSLKTFLKNANIKKTLATVINGATKLEVQEIALQESSLAYNTREVAVAGLDQHHLDLEQLNIDISDIILGITDIRANIQKLSFIENNSGLRLTETGADFLFDPAKMVLQDSKIAFNRSKLINNITVQYPFLLDDAILDIHLKNNVIALKDLLALMPELKDIEILRANANENVYINGHLYGNVHSMDIRALNIRLEDGTRLSFSGNLKNLLDTKRLTTDIDIHVFETNRATILSYLPKDILPPYVELPDNVFLNGKIKGPIDSLNIEVDAITNRNIEPLSGSLKASIQLKDILEPDSTYFTIKIDTFLTTRLDMLAYLPPDALPDYVTLPQQLLLKGRAAGTFNDLESDIELYAFRNSGNSRLIADGSVFNLNDLAASKFNVQLKSLDIKQEEILAYLPDSLLPAYLNIPFIKNASGQLVGTLENLISDITLNTNSGNFKAKATLKDEAFSASIDLEDLDLHQMLPDSMMAGMTDAILAPLSMSLEVNGNGLEVDSNMTADVKFILNAVHLDDKKVTDTISLVGKIKQKSFIGKATAQRDNLVFTADANADFNKSIPKITLSADLENIDLQALTLSQKPFQMKGQLDAVLKGTGTDTLEAFLQIDKATIQYNSITQDINSLQAIASLDNGHNSLQIRSDVLSADFKGDFDINTISNNVLKQFNQYFQFQAPDTTIVESNDNFQFQFELLRPQVLACGWFEGLDALGKLKGSGHFNSNKQDFTFTSSLPFIKYGDYILDSLQLDIQTNAKKADLIFASQKVRYGETMEIDGPTIFGTLTENEITTHLEIRDSLLQKRFEFIAYVKKMDEKYRLHLHPQQLINYKKWQLPAENEVVLEKDACTIQQLKFGIDEQYILVQSEAADALKIDFHQFQLQEFSDIFVKDTAYIQGDLTGTIVLKDIFSNIITDTNLKVRDFQLKNKRYGHLTIQADNKEKGTTYNLNLALKGAGNNVRLKGHYDMLSDFESLNFDLAIGSFLFPTIEPLLAGTISKTTGNLIGEMTIGGSIDWPDISGELYFKGVGFDVDMLKNRFRFSDKKIVFDANVITIDNFEIFDSKNRKATINGCILTENYRAFHLALDAHAKDFMVMNTTKEDNELYYGTLIVDMQASIRGDMSLPVIEVNGKPKEGSTITYLYEETDLKAIESAEGIVTFVNPKATENFYPTARKATIGTDIYGFKVTLNLELDENLPFKVILDPIAGDQFSGIAEGTMTYTLFPSGEMELIGRTEMKKGTYRFTYQDIIQRDFEVAEGSSLVWSGDPLNPEIDIRTIYKVRTSPYALLAGSQTSLENNLNDAENLRKRQTFELWVDMKGTMDIPEITLNIEYPENVDDNTGNDEINAALDRLKEDETAMNTQAFGLVLFNGFIAENMGDSDWQVVDTKAGINNLLSQQLSVLANKHVKWVDIDFDINSEKNYDESGEQTSASTYKVNLKKSFFDDRLSISVDGVSEVNSGTNTRESSAYIDNLIVEYKLNESGNFKIRLYNENDLDLFGNNVITTGAALVFSKNFGGFIKKKKRKTKH